MSNDMAVLLREQLADVIAEDPLSAGSMARWGREVFTIYGSGLLAEPPAGEGAQ